MLFTALQILPFVLGGLALMLAGLAAFGFRRSRKATFFSLRREAGQRAWRQVGLALMCTLLAGLGLFARRFAPAPADQLTSAAPPPALTPESTPSPTVTVSLPSATPSPAQPPTATATPSPPPTLAPPTSAPLTVTADSPQAPGATETRPASLEITAVATGLTNNLDPLAPGTVFRAGEPRIYYWVRCENMVNGTALRRVLLRGSQQIREAVDTWNSGANGEVYYYFESEDGWPPGSYEIRFFIGSVLADAEMYVMQ